jgi:hypothetical protein
MVLRVFLGTLIFYCALEPAHAGETPGPEWFQCSNRKECVTAMDPCGWPVGVHRDYRTRYQQFSERMAPLVECARSLEACLPSNVAVSKFVSGLDVRCDAGKCRSFGKLPRKLGCPEQIPID